MSDIQDNSEKNPWFQIKEIRYSDKANPQDNFNTADIAALLLEERLEISQAVMPACIDWDGLDEDPEENTMGKVIRFIALNTWRLLRIFSVMKNFSLQVSGWGVNEKGDLSENLRTIDLPYVSRKQCLSIVPTDFRHYVTFDKFCVGTEKGEYTKLLQILVTLSSAYWYIKKFSFSSTIIIDLLAFTFFSQVQEYSKETVVVVFCLRKANCTIFEVS